MKKDIKPTHLSFTSSSCSNGSNTLIHCEQEEGFNPVRSEMAIWRAVITQALMDAASNSGKPEAIQDKLVARRWLLGASTDFSTVCHYAGYDPEYVRHRAKGALARNCRWRAEPKSSSPSPLPPAILSTKSFTPTPLPSQPPVVEPGAFAASFPERAYA